MSSTTLGKSRPTFSIVRAAAKAIGQGARATAHAGVRGVTGVHRHNYIAPPNRPEPPRLFVRGVH